MTTTSAPYLRPHNMGQLLDRAIRLYRQNFLQFIGIIAIAQIPNSLAALLFSLWSIRPTPLVGDVAPFNVGGIFGSLGLTLISAVLLQIATAALTRAIADNYLGETTGILEAYRKIGRAWLSLIGALLIFGLLAVGLVILFIIPCLGWLAAIPGIGVLIYFSLAVIPLIAPVVVLEKQSAGRAIERAWDLARRRFWWLLGFVILLTIFAQVIVSGPTLLSNFLLLSAAGDAISLSTAVIIQQLIAFIFNVIYYPLQLTCITLVYFDTRVRTEGFDLALLMAGYSGAEQGTADAMVAAPEAKFAISTNEWGYFALITIGLAVIGFTFIAITAVIANAFVGPGGGF